MGPHAVIARAFEIFVADPKQPAKIGVRQAGNSFQANCDLSKSSSLFGREGNTALKAVDYLVRQVKTRRK
jgi:predicted RNA-binding protein Jag